MARPSSSLEDGPESSGLKKLFGEGLRFLGGGLILFPTGLAVSAFAHEILAWPEEWAAAFAFAVLVIVGFVLSRNFIFRSDGHFGRQLWRFGLIAATMRGAEYLLFLAFFRLVHISYLVSVAAALAISFALKFILYRSLVFRSPSRVGTRSNPSSPGSNVGSSIAD